MSSSPQLKEAYDLIKTGQKSRAVEVLLPVLKADEHNADGWWLMANALTEPDDIREALENVLRLRPNHPKAEDMLEKLNQRYPPKRKNDEFSFDDVDNDIFGHDDDVPKAYQRQTTGGKVVLTKSPSRGTNPLLVILAIIGGLGVFGCLACFVATSAGLFTFGQAVEQALNDPTVAAVFQELSDSITAIAGSQTLPTNLRMQGQVEFGQTVQGNVDTFVDDGWTFSGAGGSTYTIEVNARDDELDPQVFIYTPEGNLLAENDDIKFMENRNSRLTISLPSSGQYTIVVSAFGSGGAYELIVR